MSATGNGIDVHIARARWEEMRDSDVLTARQRLEDAAVRGERLSVEGVAVRGEVTKRLVVLLDALEPYVDGTMGEVTASLAAVYVSAVKALGNVYGLGGPRQLRVVVPPLPVAPPEVVVSSEEEVLAALSERRDQVRELLAGRRAELEA